MSVHLGGNYWRLWTSSVVSNLGDGISVIAYPWLASAITRDPVQIALIAVAQRLPWLLFSLPAGVITDRVDRRKLVAWMDVFRFAITITVALIVFGAAGDLSARRRSPPASVIPRPTSRCFSSCSTSRLWRLAWPRC